MKKYRRIVKIVQAAMYCKGYNGGDGEINGVWSATTTAGIVKLRGEMGISTTNKDVSSKVFKALLNMDAYVLVSGGSATIRTIQRELNGRYAGGRRDFYIIPTDGFYSRDVQRGMMYAIQYELGMNDSTANGNFGPGTRQGLSDHANFGVNGTGFLVKLYQAALIFNGFTTLYSSTFTSNTAAVTRAFQGSANSTSPAAVTSAPGRHSSSRQETWTGPGPPATPSAKSRLHVRPPSYPVDTAPLAVT